MMHTTIARTTALTALIGALLLVPVATFAGEAHPARTPADSSGSGNQATVSVLNDMSQLMQHWKTELSAPSGPSAEETQRMAGEMLKVSGMMGNMSSMMQTASKTGSHGNTMMENGHGMMAGNHRGMKMDSGMMRRMHKEMQTLLAKDEKS